MEENVKISASYTWNSKYLQQVNDNKHSVNYYKANLNALSNSLS